ncbi:MAG: sulfatase [Candidatus Cyclobacteriaceae bacterium M3_2C_046]
MKKFAFLVLTLCFFYQMQGQDQKNLNIVLIMADDLGWRDLGCMGSQYYETPAIDQLAAEGLLFTDAYAAAPVCAPTRAALMTGKSPARLHLTAVFDRDRGEMPLVPPDWLNYLPLEEITLAERLKQLGYTTAIMGKWHLGVEEKYWPENQGFDVNAGAWKSGRPDSYFPPYNNPRLKDGQADEYLTDRLADEAVGFIQENASKPFFLYFPTYNPHAPIEAPDETIRRFEPKQPDGGQDNPGYAAMIAHLDMAVAAIRQALEEAGIADRTLVIFTSDNGGVKTLWDLEITDNAPLRGEKFLLYEGGIRVPLIVKWPGQTPEGETTSQMAITTDLVPTIMSAIEQPLFEPKLDGVDLTGVFRNGDKAKFTRLLAWHYPHYMPRQDMKPSSTIRLGDYKVVHWHENHNLELYNLAHDLGETTNLAPSMPEKALEMYDLLEQWRQQAGAQMPRPNPLYK